MQDTLIDLTAGTIGGCAGIVTGQPLDTVKVRMQARSASIGGGSSWQCLLRTAQTEGWRGLFRGMAAPLLGNAPLNAILFAGYGGAMRLMEQRHYSEQQQQQQSLVFRQRELLLDQQQRNAHSNIQQLPTHVHQDALHPRLAHEPFKASWSHVLLAGSWAGLLQCVTVTPMELVKCQMQVRGAADGGTGGPLACARRLVRAGGPLALYRGLPVTILRDTPSFGSYFLVYEGLKAVLDDDRADAPPSTLPTLVAGGVAGMAAWLVTYPVDVIKSIIQTTPIDTPRGHQDRSIRHVALTHMRKYGVSFFFRGLDTALIRAFPVNAVTFFVYEWALHLMQPAAQQ